MYRVLFANEYTSGLSGKLVNDAFVWICFLLLQGKESTNWALTRSPIKQTLLPYPSGSAERTTSRRQCSTFFQICDKDVALRTLTGHCWCVHMLGTFFPARFPFMIFHLLCTAVNSDNLVWDLTPIAFNAPQVLVELQNSYWIWFSSWASNCIAGQNQDASWYFCFCRKIRTLSFVPSSRTMLKVEVICI